MSVQKVTTVLQATIPRHARTLYWKHFPAKSQIKLGMAKKYSDYKRNEIGRVARDVLLGWEEYNICRLLIRSRDMRDPWSISLPFRDPMLGPSIRLFTVSQRPFESSPPT